MVRGTHPLRVLVVEDSEDDWILTAALVRRADAVPERCADAKEAIVLLNSGAYDVALVDQRLSGGMTGLDLVHVMTASGCKVPLILLTSFAGEDFEPAAFGAGAADHLIMDLLDANTLARAIRHAVERTRVLAKFNERDLLLRAVFESTPDAIVVADDEGRYVDANAAACELFGVTREELLTRRVRDFAPELPHNGASWREFISAGHAQAFSWPLRRPDGTERILEGRATAQVIPGRHVSVLRDVTDRRRAEATNARLAAIVEHAEDAIQLLALDGTIREWNPGAERLYKLPAPKAVGRNIRELVAPSHLSSVDADLASVAAGETVSRESVRRRDDGTFIDVSVTWSPLRDSRGTVTGVCGIVRDISEPKRLQARLALADRMATIGTLAACVAHEINNPLAAVIANVEVAVMNLTNLVDEYDRTLVADALEALQDATEGGRRVREIVADLKLFSRSDNESTSAIDVHKMLRSTLRLVANEIRHRARLVEDYGADIPSIDGNESKLGQVFLNLLVNAAQAIREGDANGNEIRVQTRSSGGHVVVSITDTGQGIPAEVLPRIFDPFFTTKPIGVGTGLGLAICHSIVTQNGGEITVSSSPAGTTFEVRLPVGVLAEASSSPSSTTVDAGPRVRVAVVDDDHAVLRILESSLRRHHDITVYAGAQELLDDVRTGKSFDVVVCDLMMPQMTGMDLHASLATAAPDLARNMIFMTGGAFTPRARDFLGEVTNRCLEKPFASRDLLTLIRVGALAHRDSAVA